jgi:hypothetical protein
MRFPIALFIFLKKLPSIQFSEINIPAWFAFERTEVRMSAEKTTFFVMFLLFFLALAWKCRSNILN